MREPYSIEIFIFEFPTWSRKKSIDSWFIDNGIFQIAFTLEKHAIAVFQNLPNNNLQGIKLSFYNALPDNFNRQDYLAIAKALEIKDKTAEKYIGQMKETGMLVHEHNNYVKSKNGK